MCAGSLVKGTGSHRRGETFMEGVRGIKFIIEFATVLRWLLLIFINIRITVHVVYNINFFQPYIILILSYILNFLM